MKLLLILAVVIAFPVALFFVLRMLARRWSRTHSAHPYAVTITPAGLVVYGCVALALFYALAAYQLHRDSGVGGFIHTHGGIPAAVAVICIIGGLTEAALRYFGYSTTRTKDKPDV